MTSIFLVISIIWFSKFFKDYSVQIDKKLYTFNQIELKVKQESIKLINGISCSLINSECKSKQNVAIIIPNRNRLNNLLTFLNNMHIFLTRQKITYGIFLVEPINGIPFNRGLLFNIGYIEAINDQKNNTLGIEWDCFIFHGLFISLKNFREKSDAFFYLK